MKRIVVVLLSVLVALGITMGTGFVLADEEDLEHASGEYEVTCGASPRFPVVGEEAELTCTVLHDGIHDEEVTLSVLLARTEVGHDDHDEAEADDHRDEAESDEAEAAEIYITETDHGVYVAKYTFEQEGKYLGTTQIGEEQADFVVAVRSSPIAWFFIIGLVGVTALVAGGVVVVKTVRRKW